jgi:pimeloyl-ACP methyl ester carboxylesterase
VSGACDNRDSRLDIGRALPLWNYMRSPALVLVHGGAHAGDCWELTVNEIHRRAPDLTVLTPDLPGRRGRAGNLMTATIDEWSDSLVRDIDHAGLHDIVIVGHSAAGLTVPGAVTKLGASRVREMILAAACVPAEGQTMADVVSWPAAKVARRKAKKSVPYTVPPVLARQMFLNGVPRARRRFMAGRTYPESPRIPMETVSRRGLPDDVPRTWIMTLRDRTHPVSEQRASIEALGGVSTLIEMDTCHSLMVSEPQRLAEILVERCRLRTRC